MHLTKKRLEIPRKYRNRNEKCWKILKQKKKCWGETEKCVVNRIHVGYKEVTAVIWFINCDIPLFYCVASMRGVQTPVQMRWI